MATMAQLQSCDGFTVEGPEGCLGWVEETWFDSDNRPAAVAVRTADGRRALLLAEAVQAADPDAQEVFVGADVELLVLEAPRLVSNDGTIAATWQAKDEQLVAKPVDAHAVPAEPALAAARAETAADERPLRTALGFLAMLITVEIVIAFGIAYLVTGHPY